MELRHLRLIETVAEEGNFTRAVNKLSVSPSALSHQLKELERETGVQLFYRVNKKLVITEAGRILLRSARKIARELQKAECDLMAFRDGLVGELRITTECYTCYHWLPGLLKKFNHDFPGIEISIHTEFTNDPIAPLLEGKVDAVITSTTERSIGIEYTELFRDEMVAVVAKGHPWEGKAFVDAEDFADQQVVIYARPLESVTLFKQLLIPRNISPRKIIEMQLTEAQIELVKAGYCVKVLARWAIAPYLKSHDLVTIPLTRKGLHRSWYVASLKKEKIPGYYQAFIKSLTSQMHP
jgi:LysR family transcriptional regulator for metE and metH